jgi:uncharacterized Ntn-hydrolase superfamily protein
MAAGETAKAALAIVAKDRPHIAYRQLMAIGDKGDPAILSGAHMLGTWSGAQAGDCAASGNLLSHDRVPDAMVAAFASATGPLAARLLAALEAGLQDGGEAGPVRSCGLAVVSSLPWRIVDLRIDWAEHPIAMLREAWDVYGPQMADYIQRAKDPTRAPSYGVPGDE